MMNRLNTTRNIHQGKYKKILCVCSAGCLRSPTAAVVLAAEPFNHNTRAAGIVAEYAIIPVDLVLIEWADEVVVMTEEQADELERLFKDYFNRSDKPVIILDIPDNFAYRDPNLMKMIASRYSAWEATMKGEG
jgi:predicted protein tyrosine phosphatase